MPKQNISTEYMNHLKEEVKFLRQQVKDLSNKLNVLSGVNKAVEQREVPKPIHILNELTGKIESMVAVTNEEEQQKQDAINELVEMQDVSGAFN